MLNHITLQGRLTRDPELRYTQNNTAVASFTVACERDYVVSGGSRETDFVEAVVWRKTAEFVSNYFHKGNMIIVDGRLQFRDWNDRDGNKRRSAEILVENVYFSGSKREDKSEEQPAETFTEAAGDDEELPF